MAQPATDAAPAELPQIGEQAAEVEPKMERRPRRRARKPAPSTIEVSETSATREATESDGPAAEADAAERPKRRRTARSRTKTEAAEPRAKATARKARKPAAETAQGPAETTEQPAGNGEHVAEPPKTPVERAAQPLAASNLEQPDTAEDANRPKRRGWWQRWV